MQFENMINQIINGDCYQIINYIPDNSIDCVYIDIPYLYQQGSCGNSELGQRLGKRKMELMGCQQIYKENINTKRSDALRIAKDIKKKRIDIISIEDGIDYKIFDDLCRVMKKINIFIWCSKLQILDIMKYFIEEKKCFFEILTWHKTNPTPSTNNSWLPDTEYCLYFREQGVIYNDGYELKSKWYSSPANVGDKKHFIHPTIKPLNVVENHIKHTTKPNDIILDCFCGSGTTCVACKNTNRQYIGIEINKQYYEIAVKRVNNEDANGQISLFTI